jgi:hypothetical protein
MQPPGFAVPRPAKPEIPSRPPPPPEMPPRQSPGPEILPRPGYPSPGHVPMPDMPPPPGEAPRDAFGRSLLPHGPLRPTRSHLPTTNDRRAAFRVLASEAGARHLPTPQPSREPTMPDQPQTTQTASHPIEKSATEARQGVTPGVVRWVLALSLVAAIAAVAIVYAVMRGT